MVQIMAMVFPRRRVKRIRKRLGSDLDGRITDRMNPELPACAMDLVDERAERILGHVQMPAVGNLPDVGRLGESRGARETTVGKHLDRTELEA